MFMKQSILNVLESKKMRRHAVRNAALSAALPMGFLAAVMTGRTAMADSASITAFDNATMQPAGPRPGANGKNFFNIEGDNTGVNASYGIIDFKGGDFGIPTATGVNALTLNMAEFNAGFSFPGTIEVFLASDSSANIQVGSAGTPRDVHVPCGGEVSVSP